MSGGKILAAIVTDPDPGIAQAAHACARMPDDQFHPLTLGLLGAAWDVAYAVVRDGVVCDYAQGCPCVMCNLVRIVQMVDPMWILEAEALRNADSGVSNE